MTYDLIIKDSAIREYIRQADDSLKILGFTEHSFAHVTVVAQRAGYILEELGYSQRTVELAKIAGFLHDIGNVINRVDHSQSGAVMAFRLLDKMNFPPDEIATVISAIGNHDEGNGVPVNPVAAALIIADKADVRRSRVRNSESITSDIHDRVNYSVDRSEIVVDPNRKTLTLNLEINADVSSVMEYFEIFMSRMKMCQRASLSLGLEFSLIINGQQMV